MKQLFILLCLAVLVSCKKETSPCGVVQSSRLCTICTAQPSYIIDVQMPDGTVRGWQVYRSYKPGETYCE